MNVGLNRVLDGVALTFDGFPQGMAWYKEWFGTRYYKLLYGHRDEAEARAWVEVIIRRAGLVKGNEVLDMGCGRGRHAHWFAELGMHVTGIDLSGSSLQEARLLTPSARFEVHDMRVPYATERFDAVVCLFTSLGYSDDRTDDQRAVNAAALALRAGGVFVLDLMNGAIIRNELVGEECQQEGRVRFSIQRCVEGDQIVKRIRVEDEGCEHSFMERVHAWSMAEVRSLVESSGLTVEDITDGPEPLAFDPASSERIVIWARKAR